MDFSIKDIDKVPTTMLLDDEKRLLKDVEELNDELKLHPNPMQDHRLNFKLGFLLAIQEELIKRGM